MAMSRYRQIARLACLAHKAHQAGGAALASCKQICASFPSRGFAASSSSSEEDKDQERSVSIDGEKNSLSTDLEQATGLERAEVEGIAQGVDIFHEDWLDAPFGTPESPVQVTSAFSERVVGVPDPDDDSIIWWGAIKEGEPPRQIVEDGEYFVLKRVEGAGHHH